MNVYRGLAVWFMFSLGFTVLLCRAISYTAAWVEDRWDTPETRALAALAELWGRP